MKVINYLKYLLDFKFKKIMKNNNIDSRLWKHVWTNVNNGYYDLDVNTLNILTNHSFNFKNFGNSVLLDGIRNGHTVMFEELLVREMNKDLFKEMLASNVPVETIQLLLPNRLRLHNVVARVSYMSERNRGVLIYKNLEKEVLDNPSYAGVLLTDKLFEIDVTRNIILNTIRYGRTTTSLKQYVKDVELCWRESKFTKALYLK